MAKESLKAREVKRKKLVEKFAAKRAEAESRRRFPGTQPVAQEFKSYTVA